MTPTFQIAIVLLSFCLSLLQSQNTAIAVLDFDGIGISQPEATALSNRLRNELFRLGRFDVVDRGMMEAILSEQDFQQAGCTSNDCLVEVGKLLGAQQMVGGSISKVGGTFTVSARLVDVETGKVLSVSDFDIKGQLDDLLTDGIRIVAAALIGEETVNLVAGQSVASPSQTETKDGRGNSSFSAKPLTTSQWILIAASTGILVGFLLTATVMGMAR